MRPSATHVDDPTPSSLSQNTTTTSILKKSSSPVELSTKKLQFAQANATIGELLRQLATETQESSVREAETHDPTSNQDAWSISKVFVFILHGAVWLLMLLITIEYLVLPIAEWQQEVEEAHTQFNRLDHQGQSLRTQSTLVTSQLANVLAECDTLSTASFASTQLIKNELHQHLYQKVAKETMEAHTKALQEAWQRYRASKRRKIDSRDGNHDGKDLVHEHIAQNDIDIVQDTVIIDANHGQLMPEDVAGDDIVEVLETLDLKDVDAAALMIELEATLSDDDAEDDECVANDHEADAAPADDHGSNMVPNHDPVLAPYVFASERRFLYSTLVIALVAWVAATNRKTQGVVNRRETHKTDNWIQLKRTYGVFVWLLRPYVTLEEEQNEATSLLTSKTNETIDSCRDAWTTVALRITNGRSQRRSGRVAMQHAAFHPQGIYGLILQRWYYETTHQWRTMHMAIKMALDTLRRTFS